MTMNYEPDTVWGRTVDGDREIAQPRSGLSLTQRRLLQRLEHPRSFATFAAQNPLDPPKLEHELIALAQLHLVAFQRPGATRPRTAPSINLPLPAPPQSQATSVAILLPLCFAAAALGIASVLLLMT
jgi:hypothetical protein